jgi:hypothetical protein
MATKKTPKVDLVPVEVEVVLTMSYEEATALRMALGEMSEDDAPGTFVIFDVLDEALQQVPGMVENLLLYAAMATAVALSDESAMAGAMAVLSFETQVERMGEEALMALGRKMKAHQLALEAK